MVITIITQVHNKERRRYWGLNWVTECHESYCTDLMITDPLSSSSRLSVLKSFIKLIMKCVK